MAPRTIQMWSATSNGLADWTVSRRQGHDAGGNPFDVIIAERADDQGTVVEELRFSPSTTEEELLRYVKEVNRRQNHDRNMPEVD